MLLREINISLSEFIDSIDDTSFQALLTKQKILNKDNKRLSKSDILSPLLSKLQIESSADLITHYPSRYEDKRNITPIKDILLKGENSISNDDSFSAGVYLEGEVVSHEWFGKGYPQTLKVIIEDDSGRASLICFKRPKMQYVLPVGKRVRVYGKFKLTYRELQSTSFKIEDANDTADFSLTPVYPLREGLTREVITYLISRALDEFIDNVDDEIPPQLIEKHGLTHKREALRIIHKPPDMVILEAARRSLVYEELYKPQKVLALRMLARRAKKQELMKAGAKIASGQASGELQNMLTRRLPFSLTPGQLKAVKEINEDVASGVPMERLLEGDVGSGKTLVSFMAALNVIETGAQAALMAPTELLARQHAENAARLLEPLGVRVAFLTGNVSVQGRRHLLAALENGDVNFIVGTHALFSSDVIYKNLALVVIDEQHRFGVEQRRAIRKKGKLENGAAHLLMMSATPIPRTLFLSQAGDWDVSIINDMPSGRKKIETHITRVSKENTVYEFVRKKLKEGRQAYFVYPLIGDGEKNSGNIKDAVSMCEHLQNNIFHEYKCALVHSKIDDDEKRITMENFRTNKIQVLVATSVVEVGVDVPNATCMVIEQAERFGLSALHQLRGRVGRGTEQSYCFLICDDKIYQDDNLLPDEKKLNEDNLKRLKTLYENTDGFVIAEEDLKIRGPGQIVGTGQSGYEKLGLADPVRDNKIMQLAREDALQYATSETGG
jgi:ATP-dependent DNA helicase RecG